jgi:hypothetical protein
MQQSALRIASLIQLKNNWHFKIRASSKKRFVDEASGHYKIKYLSSTALCETRAKNRHWQPSLLLLRLPKAAFSRNA